MPPASRKVDPKWVRNPSDALAIEQGCYVDESAGSFVCEFIETLCCQSKGEDWAGKPLRLLDWQRDLIHRLFGWKKPDGRRRFRRLYCEVAKKNGKSTLVSALTLFLLLADDKGPEIYLNACDRSQARIVFDEAKKMAKASPELASRIDPVDTRHRLVWREGNGVIIANSAEAPSKDGLNPSAVIFDELHRQPNGDLWDVFKYAGAARKQPLLISITTAGESEEGVWYQQREYSEKVNAGEVPDTTHLGVVYRPPADADLDDRATWYAANPSLGVTIDEGEFARELEEAKRTPRDLATFKRLRLNIIARESGAFFPTGAWAACAAPGPFDVETFKGRPCYLGADLSSTTDLTALAAVWGDPASGYDAKVWCFLPEDEIVDLERRDHQAYRALAAAGHLTLTPGNVVDYEFLRATVKRIAAAHRVRALLIDPHMATQLQTQLAEQDGLPVRPIRQGFLSLNAPTKELLRLVLSRKLRHDGDPLLKWMAGNCVAETDAAGSVKLSKKKSRLKIDGVAALVNAIAAATGGAPAGGSVYNERDLILL